MNQRKFKPLAGIPVVLAFAFFFAPACKKSSDSDNNNNPTTEYYLTATINGKAWTSNVNNNLNQPVAAGTNQGFLLVLGIQVVNKDSTAVLLAFPANTSVNQQINFNPQSSLAAYATITTGYSTALGGGSGSFTITNYDQTKKIIEGSFSGTSFNTDGSAKVVITNGKFRAQIVENTTPKPPSNLKM